MRRNQRLLASENPIGTLRRRSLLMTRSISAFLDNCRLVGGSAKVFAVGDTENECAATGHFQQDSTRMSVKS
jgi:hypothetical protein